METEPQIIEEPERGTWRISYWVRLLVGLILLVLILNVVSVRDLVGAFRKAGLLYLLGALCLVVANIGVQILKWSYMLRFLKSVSRKEMLASFFFGITLGSFTPGQLGEYGGRAIHLPPRDWGTVLGLAAIDKLQMAGIMALAGIFSIFILYHVDSTLLLALGVATSFLILLLLLRFSLMHSFLMKLGIAKIKYAWVRQAADSLFLFTRRDIAVTTVITVVFYTIVYLQLHLLLNAFQSVTPINSFLVYAAMMFSKTLLPLSIADLGIREFSLVYFASQIGISSAAALASAILLFFINIVLPALIGLFFVPESMSISSTKR